MEILGRVLKEIVIAIVLIGIVFGIGFWLFREQIDFLSASVPNAVTYKSVDLAQYDIKGDLENQKDPTKVYQATTGSLKNLETLRKVHTGSPNPFSGKLDEDAETDIPSERVDIQNAADTPVTAQSVSGEATAAAASDAAPTDGSAEKELPAA